MQTKTTRSSNHLRACPAGATIGFTLMAVVAAGVAGVAQGQSAVGWGSNAFGQLNQPAGVGQLRDITLGLRHTSALRTDGTVVCWGHDGFNQVGGLPAGLSSVVAIHAGDNHTIAMRADGTVVCWGDNIFEQCDVPVGLAPAVGVSAGEAMSGALHADGTVTLWGWHSSDGRLNVPADLGSVTKLELGMTFGTVLRTDGTTRYWGTFAPRIDASAVLRDLAAGFGHVLGLRPDGTVQAWGANGSGQSTVPAGLTNVAAVAAGRLHSLALKQDGSVVCWGSNARGQAPNPAPITANGQQVAAGEEFSYGLTLAGGIAAPSITVVSSTDPVCGLNNGAIDTTVANADFVFWTGPSGYFRNGADLTGLAAGAYTVTAVGHGGSVSQVVTLTAQSDTTAPVVTSYDASESIAAGIGCTAAVPDFTTSVVAGDNCTDAAALVITQLPAAGTALGLGAHDITITVTDGSDNEATVTAVFTVTGTAVSYYVDADGDTFGAGAAVVYCNTTTPPGYVTNNGDCDDTRLLYADNDSDTFGAGSPVACGVASNTDCNDANDQVYPGRAEVCNGIDDNCAGGIDDGLVFNTYYTDADTDGYGASGAVGVSACERIPGTATNNSDCNDADGAINPVATEVCDAANTDENCNGSADDADAGVDAASKSNFYRDADADGYTVNAATRFCDLPVGYEASPEGDCNDASGAIYPGAVENCANDGTDNDCDGEANSDAEAIDSVSYYVDADSDSFGSIAALAVKSCSQIAGSVTNNTDCDDTKLLYADNDGDTFGAGAPVACGVPTNTDCNDASNAVYPGAVENCANDGTDNDCDGEANSDAEAVDSVSYYVDVDGDSFGSNAAAAVKSCTTIAGSVTNNADCDDTKILYADNDGDTFGAGAPVACGVVNNTDCNDASNTVYPGAVENCANDGIDNDCDGEANSDLEAVDATPYYLDVDADGFGAGVAVPSCTAIPGRVTNNLDCAPTQVTYADNDGDTFGAGPRAACGVLTNTDCNDASNAVYPGAVENCANDGTDNDCDGEANSDAEAIDSVSYYVDADSDSFGSSTATAVKSCTAIAGSVTNNADCDDTKLLYADNDGDTFGAGAPVACGVPTNTDCNDASNAVYPGAVENCANDGTDNDCDGEANSDAEAVDSVGYFVDADRDGFGAGAETKSCTPIAGSVTNNSDCNDAQKFFEDNDQDGFGSTICVPCGGSTNNADCNDASDAVYPGALENCANDGTDNDCDGEANSDAEAIDSVSYYVDGDSDTFGSNTATAVKSCTAIAGSVTNSTDCNDASNAIYPGALENCANDGTDNDCDGEANSDAEAIDSVSYYVDADGDTFGSNAATAVQSCTAIAGSVTNNGDCNDAQQLFQDNDQDGFGSTIFVACVGSTNDDDCDDASNAVYPGAIENCANDGTDNDCDGDANSDAEAIDSVSYYVDTDSDTFGSNTATAVKSCTAIAGSVTNNADCDDTTLLYADNDADTFGAGAPVACGVITNTDCNDASNAVYPGAIENCANDGTDNDCDGEANLDAEAVDSVSYYVDGDADGFGAGTETKSCIAIAGSVTNNADCDDKTLLYADNDGDTFGAGAPVACGVNTNTDCNDASNAVYPGALENCANDGTDNDCDGEANSDAEAIDSVSYYVDADSDSFGSNVATAVQSCTPIAASVTNNADCDDTKILYADNDGDTYGAGAPVACGVTSNTDCDDASNAIYPGAMETCANDGTDNDCDGQANSDAEAIDSVGYFVDGDADGFGAGTETKSCTPIPGSVTNNADCDDTKLLYADDDGDTFGAGAPVACGVITNTDCNDADSSSYPGAIENCANDGTDNDCDGEANSDAEAIDSVSYYVDGDSDSFGSNVATAVQSCTPIAGSVTNNADCDDTKILYADNDGDTYGAGAPVACGVTSNTDCNDASNAIYPGAIENCANDGTDNDCDGESNSDAEAIDSVSYYVDGDQDGFGAGTETKSCTAIAGSVTNNADCDDTKLLYADNDGDSYGAGAPVACGVITNTDCNDASNAVYPGAVENCANDGTDNDCDGEANSDAEAIDSVSYYVDADSDTFGSNTATAVQSCTPIAGSVTNNSDCDDTKLLYADNDADTYGAAAPVACGVTTNTDCNDASNAVYPGALEDCANDGTDNDCDGIATDDAEAIDSASYYVDADGDSFGSNTAAAVKSCTAIAGSVTNNADCDDTKLLYADNDGDTFGAGAPVACGVTTNTDCNDASNAVYPGALENCANDGIDNDCDGEANSDLESVDAIRYYVDADTDSFGSSTDAGVRSCTAIPGRVPNNTDCDDTKLLYADNDGDTFGAGAPVACGVTTNTDCNDASNAVYPGAIENCANDGTDNDCDGEANSDLEAVDAIRYYLDADTDSFGSSTDAGVRSCTAIPGRVTNNADCDDTKLLYADNDGDTYGAGAPVACGVTTNTDCNDASNAVYPGAVENCANDGTDNDCDGEANSDLEAIDAIRYYLDSDSDTFGSNTDAGVRSCSVIPGRVPNNADCDDTKLLYADNDGDTYGAGAPAACGVTTSNDCNDSSNAVYPGAVENCANDGTDNDCDGEANSDAEAIDSVGYFVDGDQDGFGSGAETKSCTAIAGSVTNNTDCNDAAATVYPGAPEQCNDIDDNCNTTIDDGITTQDWYPDTDGDGYGDASAQRVTDCRAPAGHVPNNLDCNDANAAIKPGAAEVCNGIDDDCDAQPDDGLTFITYYEDADADAYGRSTDAGESSCKPVPGKVANNLDCNDANGSINPDAAELCSNLGTDNDCDGINTEEEASDRSTFYRDADGDTFTGSVTALFCTAPAGYEPTNEGDCNDADNTTYPGAPELCSNLGTDNDCDTVNTEEEASDRSTFYRDADGDTFTGSDNALFCTAPAGYEPTNEGDCNDADSTTYPGAAELCSNLGTDNDCDKINTEEEASDRSTFYRDADGDTFTGSDSALFCIAPSGYEPTNEGDCNDADVSTYPGAAELCSNLGTDNDCDKINTEEEASDRSTFYRDADGDTFTGSESALFCTAPAGYESRDEGDCNDADVSTYPGAPELCSNLGTDNDCDTVNTEEEASDRSTFYRDADGDTFTGSDNALFCTAPAGYEPTNEGDCNDADNTTYPGAAELCSNLGTDNDCDGVNTEEEASDRSTFYRDADGDTFTGSESALFCTAPAGYEPTNEGDCNDDDNTTYPGAAELCSNLGTDNDCDGVNTEEEASDRSTFYRDADGDTFTGSESALFCTAPAGYESRDEGDCNDANSTIYPGAAELCSNLGTDNDCDGVNTEEEASDRSTFYRDADGDSFTGSQIALFCIAPAGYEPTNEGDCNDENKAVYPGAPELCSNLGTDNDCDGVNTEEEASDRSTFYRDADGDGFTGSVTGLFCTARGEWEPTNEGDCNDANNTIYPGAAELCSNLGTDNDCDGVNTEAEASDRSTFYRDADGDGVTGSESALFCIAPPGYEPTNEGDCNDANPAIYPGAAELCNGIDDNCSGGADEGLTFSDYYPDVDGDGFGAGEPVNACAAPSGYVLGRGDGCPVDPNKQAPGVCGCGIADADINGNDVIDCKDVELYMVPMTTGVLPGEEYRVRVSAMSPSAIIALTGMQLAVKFDATRIALVDVEPVEGTPLSFEIAQNINNSSAIGTLRYAIGVDAGASGLTGPADLVDLVFTVLDDADVCAQDVQLAWFENVGTFRTVLVTPPPAVSVFPTLSSLLPLDLDITDPVLAGVPESVAIPADAGSSYGAFVAAPTVTVSDNCTDPIALDLVIDYPGTAADATEWPIDGMFPVGLTTARWSAIDETGNMVEAIRTIEVFDYALADLSITLEGLQRGASTRSIRVTAEGVASLTDVTFNPGVGAVLATVHVPVSSTIACVEVKDTVHSLTSTTAPSIVGTRYTGSVTLLQGDSNDDDKVDIADFTLFVGDRSVPGNSDREPNARSNFDGNRFVNTADFSFISTNFFRRGQSCTAGADGDAALSRISVKELRRQGLGHLDGADLNRDGWVDMRDMQIFIQGGPVTGSPSAPEGSVDSGW